MFKKYLKYTIQYFIAVILLTTAIGKLLDIQGFAKVIESYEIFSGWITAPMGLAMALFELFLSIWLFSGKKLALAALVSFGLHSVFTTWTVWALLRGLELSNCGCFGVFWARPLGWSTVYEDLFMVAVSLVLFFLAKQSNSSKKLF